jgi:hypothetical protein
MRNDKSTGLSIRKHVLQSALRVLTFIVSQICAQIAFALPGPVVLYTDILSGPATGGENNKGIYLSIFGKNFGGTGLGTTVKVFINDVEVDNYRYLGVSRGRPDIQQISVQVGAIGNPAPQVPLPIKVVVNGLQSNTDNTFTVNAGNIYFVNPDPAIGNDGTGTGAFNAPYKTVQKPAGVVTTFQITPVATGGVWGILRAGDFIVLRGGTYVDIGFSGPGNPSGTGYFLQAFNKSGCPIGTNCAQGGGTSSGPITVMGFPGETAFINRTNTQANKDNNFGGGISSADSARQDAGYGAWFTLTNLKIESGFTDGPINTQKGDENPILGSHWRVVNNELTAFSCAQSTLCRAGAIAGGGAGNFWVGNYGHDIYDKPDANTSLENHGIYIGGGGSYEIAYNVFENIIGGNGFQIQSLTSVTNVATRLRIHHNIIRNVGKHGLNFTQGTGVNTVVWNNLIYDTDYAGIRFSDDNLRNFKLYNNTFYNVGRVGNTASGAALVNDTNAATGMFDIRNNIFWVNAATNYSGGCCNGNFTGGSATFSNNLWFGKGAAPSFDAASPSANPSFISAGSDFRLNVGSPAIDTGTSAVSAVVIDDFEIANASVTRTLRPPYGSYDIGAYERSPAQCRLDLDGDGSVRATTDAAMITRITRTSVNALNASVVAGLVAPIGATRTDWATQIKPYLATSTLDVDGDGAGTSIDALLITRAALGLTGNAVTAGIAFGASATRKTWSDIRGHLVNECNMVLLP